MEYGGPQVTSCVDTNLALDQGVLSLSPSRREPFLRSTSLGQDVILDC
jgi:hypothetical protein